MARTPARSVLRVGGIACAIVSLAAGWFQLAPPALGGGTSYAIVNGASMRPHLHSNDLVLLRGASSYRIGDAVAYRDPGLGVTVLHRIVRQEGERFVTKGDNNGFTDPYHPMAKQIVGREWLVVPGVGRVLGSLQRPVIAALAAALLSLVLLGGGILRKREAPPRSEPEARESGVPPVAGGLLLVAGCALALAFIAFRQPPHRIENRPGAYRESSSIDYAARVRPSIAYPDGLVTTGDAVYRQLVRAVTVRFRYTFASRYRHERAGRAWISAHLSDGNGWRYPLPAMPVVRFRGDGTSVTGQIDLQGLTRAAQRFERLTGAASSAYLLSLDAHVESTGRVDGRPMDTDFAQHVAFTLDSSRLSLDPPRAAGAAGIPIRSSRTGGSTPTSAVNRIAFGPAAIDVVAARRVGLAVAIAALLALACLLPNLLRRLRPDAHAGAGRSHRSRVIASEPTTTAGHSTGAVPAVAIHAGHDEHSPPPELEQLARLNRRRTRGNLEGS